MNRPTTGPQAQEKSVRTPTSGRDTRRPRSIRDIDWRKVYHTPGWRFLAVIIIALAALAGPLSRDAFFTTSELQNVIRNQSTLVIMAAMAVFVIAAGEIDLSFAAVVPVAAYAAALAMPHAGVLGAVAAALGVGVATGLFNGIIVVLWGLPSFIVTLGTMGILNGAAIWVTNSQPVSVSNSTFATIFGNHSLGPIHTPLLWVVGVTVIGYLVLNWTPAGKKTLAVGANRAVAEACGIRVARVQLGVMVASGIGGAVAGLLYTGLLGSADYTLGSSDLLIALAAAIIGGTSLAGGKGSVIGATIAALLLGLLESGLILLGFGVPQQTAFQGAVIVFAIIIGEGKQLAFSRWREAGRSLKTRWQASPPAGIGSAASSVRSNDPTAPPPNRPL